MRLVVTCGMLLVSLGNPCADANAAKPHLVLVISDDHSWRDCSLGGATDIRAPHLERLAGEGVTFTRAFAVSPSCAPSRAALLTGLYPMQNGSMFNHQPPQAEVKKLPAYLHEQGYEVVAFGKVAHYQQGQDYGFDLVAHDTFHDDRCVDAAIQWLNQRTSDQPLCLLVGTNWPHVPWPTVAGDAAGRDVVLPPTHIDTPETRRYRAQYYAAIKRMDDDLGRVYEAAYRQLGDNTLLLHFSDQGAQWPFGKWNLYDAGLQVAMVAVWPGVIEPGSQNAELTSLIDVLPTLIEAAGDVPPPDLPGRSLVPRFTGSVTTPQQYVFASHSGDGKMNRYPMRSIRSLRWKYIRNLDPPAQHTSHITGGSPVDGRAYWRTWLDEAGRNAAAAAIVERSLQRPAEELYDLEADPFEQRNLAANPDRAAILAELRGQLDQWMASQGDEGLSAEKAAARAFFRSN